MTAPDPLDLAYHAAVKRGSNGQAELLEQALEEATNPPRRNGIRMDGAAMWYANRGMRVFPLLAGEKRPLPRTHGVKDATDDPDVVAGWRLDGAEHNLGIATGGPYDVVDIDGRDGAEAFAAMIGDGAWLIVCGVSQTPRGWHLWVPADPNAQNFSSSVTHIDYRGQGGYVVAPPSHVGGTIYRWLLPPRPVTEEQA